MKWNTAIWWCATWRPSIWWSTTGGPPFDGWPPGCPLFGGLPFGGPLDPPFGCPPFGGPPLGGALLSSSLDLPFGCPPSGDFESAIPLTCSESVYVCNFAICTNEHRLQCPDTKAPRNTTECKVYNASNKDYLSKAGWSA